MDQNIKSVKSLVVLVNCILVAIGQVGGAFLVRLYFLHGGKRQWLSAWLLTAGFPILIFPILIFPIAISYAKARANTRLVITPRLAASSAFLGALIGLDGYLYSFGLSYLPISVSSLLGSTNLAFTAIFAFVIVKQKFTHYAINAVVLMTFGSVVLGMDMKGDRPIGVSHGEYLLGFWLTLSAALLHGFIMPAVEYTHLKAGVPVTFNLVMQFQFLVSLFATLFCSVPLIITKGFQAIPEEAREYGLGETKYYMILVLGAIAMQLLLIGSLGVVFCSTSLLGGLVASLLLPVQQVFAVLFLPESFNADKGIALAICLWGFSSYFYGQYKLGRAKLATKQEAEQGLV